MEKRDIQKAFGNNVKRYRAMSGKNQEEFAFLADMSAAYLSELERGEKCPTIDTAYKISSALNITLAELLNFDSGQHIESESYTILKNTLDGIPDKNKLKLARAVERLAELYQEEIK